MRKKPYSCLRPLLVLLSLVLPLASVAVENVDIIVSADYIVTMDSARPLLKNAAIAIDKGEIIAIGDTSLIKTRYHSEKLIPGKQRLLMPGLINGHTHSAMTLFRGLADDLPLMDWLTKYIFPAEIRFVDPQFVRTGTRLACLEMIKGGTTSFVDMYFHPDEIAAVVEECGVRAIIGAAVIEQESGYTKNFADAMQKAESFIGRWQGKNSRITPAIAAHAAYTISPANLKFVRERANALGVPVAIHLAESKDEMEIIDRLYHNTSINHLQGFNFFSGPTIAAHVVWPTAAEIALLAKYRVAAIHNPTSNMKIASGFAPVPEMLAAGVPLGLGTDGAASNNDLNMWDEIRMAALIHKGRLLDPKTMPAAQVLALATNAGAAAIGLGETTGRLSVGLRADIIQISLQAAHLVPLYDLISHLVYAVDAGDVETVIVDGKVLMEDRRLLTLDEDEVIASARAIAAKIDAAMRSDN